MKTRTWARDSGSIFTTYNYDPNTAELINILYSDITMTDISFSYDRLGRQDSITDALGGRDFDYSTGLQLETETITGLYNKTITREYDTTTVIGRYEGLNTGVEYQISYGYDTAGRLNAVSYNSNGTVTGTATYGYLNNSGLIETLTTTTGQVSTYGYEPDRNLRTQVWNQFNGATVSQYDSGYNAAGQRTSVLNVGTAFAATAFNRFDYNDRSELKEFSRYLGNNIYDITQPVQSEYRHYEYDPIGNRSGITEASNNGSYISNNLNQYTTETPPGGGSNTYVHDEDGNLTSIAGNRNVTYTYNAENRLIAAQPTAPSTGDKKVEFLYDYQGRRVQKIISSWNGSWTVDTTKHFVYDGWNVIQEITTAQPTKYYVWGLDLSQSMQGAGGVGGLLTVIEGTSSWNYLYDGNGNVGQMLNSSTGAIEAHYEYDPYGNEIQATGAVASSNPYRFSTKYLDDEFNLYYYGYR
ncbi:MAG: hypothetical protein K8S27_03650, partial [Candidatus Omnitrophica bacterium]|nr:hypothetical protein [Candidatus Omnitrophota bacterium]